MHSAKTTLFLSVKYRRSFLILQGKQFEGRSSKKYRHCRIRPGAADQRRRKLTGWKSRGQIPVRHCELLFLAFPSTFSRITDVHFSFQDTNPIFLFNRDAIESDRLPDITSDGSQPVPGLVFDTSFVRLIDCSPDWLKLTSQFFCRWDRG